MRFRYGKADSSASGRDVEPVCLVFWGQSWTLGAWCRMRTDFRNFRVDRMDALEILADGVSAEPSRDLRAYLAAMGADPDFEL